MPDQTLNVALLGTRFMGRAHSNAYLKLPRFFPDLPVHLAMHTIVGRNTHDTPAFARQWTWPHHSTNWRDVIENPDITFVDVATPNHLHHDQAIAALEAAKHVACEKPLAHTLEHARAMRDAATRAQGQTFVWFNYRRCPALALARQLVHENHLGPLYHVRAAYLQDWAGPNVPMSWRFDREQAGSGAHGDLNAHLIDAVRFITGQQFTQIAGSLAPTFIKQRDLPDATGKSPSTVDDALLFLAQLDAGTVASFEASRLSTGDKNANRIEIHGHRGALRFHLERMNELQWFDATLDPRLRGWSTINVTEIDGSHPYFNHYWKPGHIIGYEHTFINQLADIAAALAHQPPLVPLPDFNDAYQTQRVLTAALESARHACAIPLDQIQ